MVITKEKNTIVNEYMEFSGTYMKKYGNKTICLYQCGLFYEVYSPDENEIPIHEYSNILNLVCTKKDKSKKEISLSNPYLIGFPCVSKDKYIKILVNEGYTVVIIEQKINNFMRMERVVTEIFTSGTYIDNTKPETNNIMTIYIEDEKQTSGKLLTCSGISIIDISTGICYIHEVHSLLDDMKYAIDEIKRIMCSFYPKEIIIIHNKKNQFGELTKNDILSFLDLESKPIKYYDNLEKEYFKISYQNNFLAKIYSEKFETMCPLEYLDINKMIFGTISFIFLLNYLYKQNEKIIKKIEIPKKINSENYLVLGNNAPLQLNLIETDIYDIPKNSKFKCVYDVINNVSTPMGKRFLKEKLLIPSTNIEKIKKSYDCIEKFITNKIYIQLEKYLNEICDIERLRRKIIFGTIYPCELSNFIFSIQKIDELITFLFSINYDDLDDISEQQQTLKSFITEIQTKFDLDILCEQSSLDDLKNSFFKSGICADIDELQNQMDNGISCVDLLCEKLITYLDEKKMTSKDPIKVNKNNKDGYFFVTSKLRANSLKKKLSNIDKITIGKTDFCPTDFIYKDYEKTVRIFFPKIEINSEELTDIRKNLLDAVKQHYLEELELIRKTYDDVFKKVIHFVSKIDYYKSGAKTAILYNYCKPEIIDNEHGFIKCKHLRHPIIERIIKTEYKCHDIDIGNKMMKGMLLYSLNGGGKSSLMKSVGISVILAQAGLYVPASQYEFSPYKTLYARITSNDNMFQNMSSFGVEMHELKAILTRCNNSKSLCIGDEISKGTEASSGTAIVAATIIQLSQSNVSFIFSTHLHNIVNIKQIITLTNVKSFHLSVDYDHNNDILIYDRSLKEGSGQDDYGLIVAKYILNNDKFIDEATKIKNELKNSLDDFLSMDKSRYNKDVYYDKCELCGEQYSKIKNVGTNLETHHIKFQKDCDENDFLNEKSHIKKNSLCNLIVLCKKCHDNVHNNKILLCGYKETSKGKQIVVKK